jgi:hypothetical protein
MKYFGHIKHPGGLEKRIRVYARKEEEWAIIERRGSGYHRRNANECIVCGTSCL